MTLIDLGPPAAEPVTLADLKTWCRIEREDEDALVVSLGKAARETVEALTRTILSRRGFRLVVDVVPADGWIEVPRVRLEAASATPDGSGGVATNWSEVAELSAHVEPVSADVRERFAAREGRVTHRVICRFRSDVARGMVFVFKGRRLAIRTVHDPDESGRFLVCRCEEEA